MVTKRQAFVPNSRAFLVARLFLVLARKVSRAFAYNVIYQLYGYERMWVDLYVQSFLRRHQPLSKRLKRRRR